MERVLERCEIVLYADGTLIFTDDKTDNLCVKVYGKYK